MNAAEWGTLLYLKASDFKTPAKLDASVVRALDHFIGTIGAKPTILSDYREGDDGQHGQGRAIDTTWPGISGQTINTKALASGLFSGIGVYVNEVGAISHHFDTRTDRTPANPATWGGVITHPIDGSTMEHVKKIEYISMAEVLNMIKKKESLLIIPLLIFGYILWRLSRKT